MRTGELLAAIGAIGLALLLAVGSWFSYSVAITGTDAVTGAVGARHLGWFAVLFTFLAAIAGLLFLLRVLTAPTTERIMLQAPIAFIAAVFALLVDAVRMFVFPPEIEASGGVLAKAIEVSADVSAGGFLGLGCLLLIAAGSWVAMADERKGTAAAKVQTQLLLEDIPVRPAPPAGGTPETDADAIAQDAVPDVSSDPSTEPSDAPTHGDPA